MFRAGDIRGNVLLKFTKALYVDAMFVSLWGEHWNPGGGGGTPI